MRFYYDENGKPIRGVAIPFEEVPEEYEIKTIKLNNIRDLSYLGYIRKLSDDDAFKQFYNDNEAPMVADIVSHLAMDYLKSAISLQNSILKDRNGPHLVVSRYSIPCIFCCRHAIELKLKQCVFKITNEKPSDHSIIKLWAKLISTKFGSRIMKLNPFIQEVNAMDGNEIVMRYGMDKDLKLLKEDYLIDVDALIQNTKYLFNVMTVECSCF